MTNDLSMHLQANTSCFKKLQQNQPGISQTFKLLLFHESTIIMFIYVNHSEAAAMKEKQNTVSQDGAGTSEVWA